MNSTKKNLAMSKVTVGEMIESLSKFDKNLPVEIAISQANKIHPVAYCVPQQGRSNIVFGGYAESPDGRTVRLHCSLPSSNDYMTITVNRKTK